MTGFPSGTSRLPAELAATRDGWHKVAEHILAAVLRAETGEIALMPSPGGLRTPPLRADGTFLATDGTELIPGGTGAGRRAALTTLGAAAEFAGITPSAPAQVYQPATPLDLDEPLIIDPVAACVLADWSTPPGLSPRSANAPPRPSRPRWQPPTEHLRQGTDP